MSDWLHNLPIFWMAVVIFGVTYLVAVAIYAVVRVVAKGERARSFKVVSPSVFPPWAHSSRFLSCLVRSRSGTITIGRPRR